MKRAGRQHSNPDRSYADWITLSMAGGGGTTEQQSPPKKALTRRPVPLRLQAANSMWWDKRPDLSFATSAAFLSSLLDLGAQRKTKRFHRARCQGHLRRNTRPAWPRKKIGNKYRRRAIFLPMTSQLQIKANRGNSKKFTGPARSRGRLSPGLTR